MIGWGNVGIGEGTDLRLVRVNLDGTTEQIRLNDYALTRLQVHESEWKPSKLREVPEAGQVRRRPASRQLPRAKKPVSDQQEPKF